VLRDWPFQTAVVTGLLFEPGNAADLAVKIRHLWDRPDLCQQMGRAGREKALREYSPEKCYERLMAVYERVIALGPGGPHD
jgi:glycosyltransferase involved in cell wall biosynthesis